MKFKLLVVLLFAFLGAFAQPSQYTPMTAQGYQMKRVKVDSTLHLPSFCGTPTLRGSASIDGAIAIDTCANVLYKWTNAGGWSAITGGGGSTDTTSLSNRIDARVKYTDTAAMLANYLTGVDTISLNNRINNKIDSVKRVGDSVKYYKNGVGYFAFLDSVGGGSSVANDTAKVVIAKVHNAETTTLTRGTVVYLYGANGDVASAKRANNKQDSTSSKTFGIVRRDIAAGDTGYITTEGQIEKLNLGAYTAGDMLYLDSIDGQFTKFKPVAPYHLVNIGVVERANNGNGLAFVKVQNGFELSEIHDCQISNVINNQILVYSDTQKIWKNRNVYTVVDTTSLSNRINTKLNATDTTVFQRKQLHAYSFTANGTNAAANGSATYFKDTSGTYTGTITWTGTTAPSGATNHSYRWTRIGKMVTLNIILVYATNGGALGQLVLDLPSDAPSVAEPAGLTGANQNMYPVLIWFASSTNALLSNAPRGFIRNNAANTANDIIIQMSSSAVNTAHITVTYYTN